jgi:5-methylcytosine-specific restriction endonuclease McrA
MLARKVTLVAGPPCAGKSYYVREHASPGALVLDQDVIGRKAMNKGLASIHRTTGEVWVIRCAPGELARAGLARRLGCDDVVLLCPDVETLHARAAARPNPVATRQAIRSWMLKEHGLSVPRGAGRTGHRARQVREQTFERYGRTCWICGHDGAGESDHVVPLAEDAGLALVVENRRPAHGSSSRCPTCGRACNQERGTKKVGSVFVPSSEW